MTSGFSYTGEQLCCDGLPVNTLAERYGTPLYLYSRRRLVENYERMAQAFAPLGAGVFYAIKANGTLALLRVLAGLGSGFDAVSAGEVFRALQAGADPARILFAGAGKTGAELAYAVDARVGRLVVEAPDELERLQALAARAGRTVHVALRLNPDVHAHTHAHLDTGHSAAKFGMSAGEAAALFAARARFPHILLEGVHVHIGSQNTDPAATVAAARAALALADEARASGARVTHLDLGGGFPVAYRPGETVPPPEAFAQALAPVLAGRGLQLLIEPGRAIVADAGALIVTLQSLKHRAGRRILVVDGGMSELIRPALYGAYHQVVPLSAPSPDGDALEPADVAGPICESADVLARDRRLPALAPGDRLAVLHAGAYGTSMASNYNARPRPAEVLVDGGDAVLIARRETLDDLIAREL